MFFPLNRGYEKGPERLAQGLMFWMNSFDALVNDALNP